MKSELKICNQSAIFVPGLSFLMVRRPPRSTHFPNTTLFRSAMKLHYANNNIEMYDQYNSASDICGSLELGLEPECKLVHGQFVKPMLAKARKGKERPTDYIVDIKYDGNRYQIHKEGESVIIFNRKGKIVSDQYPDIVDIVSDFEVSSIILDKIGRAHV